MLKAFLIYPAARLNASVGRAQGSAVAKAKPCWRYRYDLSVIDTPSLPVSSTVAFGNLLVTHHIEAM